MRNDTDIGEALVTRSDACTTGTGFAQGHATDHLKTSVTDRLKAWLYRVQWPGPRLPAPTYADAARTKALQPAHRFNASGGEFAGKGIGPEETPCELSKNSHWPRSSTRHVPAAHRTRTQLKFPTKASVYQSSGFITIACGAALLDNRAITAQWQADRAAHRERVDLVRGTHEQRMRSRGIHGVSDRITIQTSHSSFGKLIRWTVVLEIPNARTTDEIIRSKYLNNIIGQDHRFNMRITQHGSTCRLLSNSSKAGRS
tara:strand:- start:3827 stop:4597 length:771 start_codon:yes stop_codon:yes gene_type:complete